MPQSVALLHAVDMLDKYGITAVQRISYFFDNILKVKKNNQEQIVIIGDSLADLAVIAVLAKVGKLTGNETRVIYYRTNVNDNTEIAHSFLTLLEADHIKTVYFDHLENGEAGAVEVLKQTGVTACVSDLFDSYDLRYAINDFAAYNYLSIVEAPTLDLPSLTSGAFSTNMEEMRKNGEAIVELLKSMVSYLVEDERDGTHLTVKAGRMINEASNDFSHRPADYKKDPNLPEPVQDNYPCGEVWSNIYDAQGTIVFYQVEPDMLRWGIRNNVPECQGWTEQEVAKRTYDPQDPIHVTVVDGYITDIQGGVRATILRLFLKDQSQYDVKKGRAPNVTYRLAELAWGINPGAKNPEEVDAYGNQIISVLITEKVARVPHIAIGNLPDSGDTSGVITESDTHIDHGLRNKNLRIWGIKDTGEKVLLTANGSTELGAIDIILG